MKCCNEERSTMYCPDCGKQLLKDSLSSLKSFLIGRMKQAQKSYQYGMKWNEEHPEESKKCWRISMMQLRKRKVDQFESWVKYLDSMTKGEIK